MNSSRHFLGNCRFSLGSAIGSSCALAVALLLSACGPQSSSTAIATGTPVPTATQQPIVLQDSAADRFAGQQSTTPPIDGAATQVLQGSKASPAALNAAPSIDARAQSYVPSQDEAPPPMQRVTRERTAVVAARAHLGEVQAVEPIRDRPKGNGTGAVIGGVLGAVVGNQFGHGGGRAITTVLGGVGGAVAGNNVERNHREGVVGYRVSVRFDNGVSRTFRETNASEFRVGDRVRVDRGQLRPI